MSLRLFRITEFAESRQLTPLMQRHAHHPYAVILLLGAWMAGLCNVLLWQAMRDLPPPARGSLLMLGLGVFGLVLCALVILMSLFQWRYVFKPAMTVLLLLVALNTYSMLRTGTFLQPNRWHEWGQSPSDVIRSLMNLTFWLCMVGLFGAPTFYLWRCRLRRFSVVDSLRLNLAVVVLTVLAMCLLLVGSYQGLAASVLNNPALRDLINPINMGWALVQAPRA